MWHERTVQNWFNSRSAVCHHLGDQIFPGVIHGAQCPRSLRLLFSLAADCYQRHPLIGDTCPSRKYLRYAQHKPFCPRVLALRILGLVCDTHDSGIALLDDGQPRLVIEEERLNRVKHTKRFPSLGLDAALAGQGLRIADVDVLTTPWDVRKLRYTFVKAVLARFPESLNLTNKRSHPPQRNEIVFLNQRLRRDLKRQLGVRTLPPLINVGHHDAHAAAFFVSPFDEASVLVMDGYGDDASTSVYTGRGSRLERRWHLGIFNSLGMVYTFVTHYLGFAGFADEGKVMALAALGDTTYVEKFRALINPTADGRYDVDMSYFDYDAYGMLRPFSPKFIAAFGPPRASDQPLGQRHMDIARALQALTEDVVLHVVRGLGRAHSSRNLVLTGGVALNCVANARILTDTDFRSVWVPPIASDSGAPLGSALWHQHQTLGRPRDFVLTNAAYGVGYDDRAIRRALDAAGLIYDEISEADMIERTARDLAGGRVVGWFQGRFEMGPRALGNRSILADPRALTMRDTINAKIKKRESFRPFAPAVLRERVADFFEFDGDDPFMTMAPRARPAKAALIPAGIHVDETGRIQTVSRDMNSRYYDLIRAFDALTGVPVLLNTSFNEQEPIVATPEDAIACYLRTGLDTLVLGTFYTRDKGAHRTIGDNQVSAVPPAAAVREMTELSAEPGQ